MALQAYNNDDVALFDRSWIEQVILELSDHFNIRVIWDKETAILTSVLAFAGGLIGGYSGGRLGAVLGVGVGSVTGLGVSAAVSLREIWLDIKDKLKELIFIVYNYLRRLDAIDMISAADILMSRYESRRELVLTILEFIAHKLGREVISSITAA